MKFIDWRKTSPETQEVIRKQAVLAVVEGDESAEDVIRILGLTESRLYDWLAKYRKGGFKLLNSKTRGGSQRKLKDDQADWIAQLVENTTPDDFGYEALLWNRELIGELIEQEYGIHLSKSTVGRLLHRSDLSYQKVCKHAYQQDSVEVEHWLKEKFPKIQQQAQQVGGVIFFMDEAGIRSNAQGGRTWGRVGQTPEVEQTGARFGLNILSAISIEGKLCFHLEKNSVNGETFLVYLKQLVHREHRPIFLIVDRHPAHLAKIVTEYVQSSGGRLYLETLPAYSPELNPAEYLWNELKNHRLTKYVFINFQHLFQSVSSQMHSLQSLPKIIRSFFFEKHVRYASSNSCFQ